MSALDDGSMQEMAAMFLDDVKNLTLKKWTIIATVYLPVAVLGINTGYSAAYMFAMFINIFVAWATYDAEVFAMFMNEPLYFYAPVLIIVNVCMVLLKISTGKPRGARDVDIDKPKTKEE